MDVFIEEINASISKSRRIRASYLLFHWSVVTIIAIGGALGVTDEGFNLGVIRDESNYLFWFGLFTVIGTALNGAINPALKAEDHKYAVKAIKGIRDFYAVDIINRKEATKMRLKARTNPKAVLADLEELGIKESN